MDRSARTPAPPSSAALCPGCGLAVDPLRAGHVAILDDGFRYFHDARCKAAFVDVTSMRTSLEARTADPPGVSGVRTAEPPIVLTGVSSTVVAREAETDTGGDDVVAFPAPPVFPTPTVPDAMEMTPLVAETTDAPSTLRSPDVVETRDDDAEAEETRDDDDAETAPPSDAPESREDREDREEREDREDREEREEREARNATTKKTARASAAPAAPREVTSRRSPSRREGAVSAFVREAAPVVGITCGLLAVAVALAGETARTARLPLAVFAALVAIGTALAPGADAPPRGALAISGVRRAPRIGVALSLLAALAATLVVRATAPHRTDVFAAFLGFAAASELVAALVFARARKDVDAARAALATALPREAKVVRPAGRDVDATTPEIVGVAEVKPGDVVVVAAAEVVPVDGVVVSGRADVAPWVDAPTVVTKREGHAVVAGASVTNGTLRVSTTFSGAERAFLRLSGAPGAPTGDLETTAPMLAFARRVALPAAPGAAAVAAAATYASNGSMPDVLLAACAGATLVAARSAISAAALAHARGHVAAFRRGAVYRNADAFDVAARVDIAVVCSRGTVLLGEPETVAVEAVTPKGLTTQPDAVARVLALAAGAEVSSTHPFAAAVLRAARARGVEPETVRSPIGHSGLGVTALATNGDRVVVGSRAFLLQEKISVAVADTRIAELEAEGRSVLLVALAEKLVGLLALQDGLRAGARAAVQRLHDADIEPVLLSGEARDTCESLARSLDIDHVRPEILPADRGAEVRALAEGGHVVAVIGHPAIDDNALGAADVSVAMSAAGSAPGEWSVVLASDDVRDAALALAIPRACRERSRKVFAVGVGAQVLSTLAVAFGVLPPAVVPVIGACVAVAVASVVRDVTSRPS